MCKPLKDFLSKTQHKKMGNYNSVCPQWKPSDCNITDVLSISQMPDARISVPKSFASLFLLLIDNKTVEGLCEKCRIFVDLVGEWVVGEKYQRRC